MDRKKYNYIKRLGKAHIWPSVVLLIISLGVAIATVFATGSNMLVETVQERYDSTCENTSFALRTLSVLTDDHDRLRGAVADYDELQGEIFIIGADGEVIYKRGTPTYTKQRLSIENSRVSEENVIKVFTDESTSIPAVSDNEDIRDGIEAALLDFVGEGDELTEDTAIYEIVYWIGAEFDDSTNVMVKCTAALTMKDLDKVLLSSALSLVIFLIPVFFLFLNVILSIINQRRMRKMLYTSTVTAGRNYTYFEHSAARLLNSRKIIKEPYMVMDITVMKYRGYCNFHGSRAGEELLSEIDRLITSKLGKKEICAFTGESSFALYLKYKSDAAGKARADVLIKTLSEKISHKGVTFHCGLCFINDITWDKKHKNRKGKVSDPSVYYNYAVAARASLKDENISDFAVYDEKLMEAEIWEHRVEDKMENALKNKEFCVYIQPKYDPVTEKLAGAEALVRWINEEDGFISPGKFIPIFEKNGFITKLDDYMLENIARLQAGWIAEKKKVVPISVNVSRAHFADPNLAEHICGIIDRFDVPHHLIEIELTESAFFDDRNMMLTTVRKLRNMGFEISMDDFGAGYSSLNSLKDLPLDVLKLDAEFFRGEDSQERGEIVVSQAIALAKKLNMRIVAEGIEKKEQVEFLAKQGCDMIQGYYYAKPMPSEEYAAKL